MGRRTGRQGVCAAAAIAETMEHGVCPSGLAVGGWRQLEDRATLIKLVRAAHPADTGFEEMTPRHHRHIPVNSTRVDQETRQNDSS